MSWYLLAVDPGRDKIGLAVLAADGAVAYQRVIPAAEFFAEVDKLVDKFKPHILVMGDGTGAKSLKAELDKRKTLGPSGTIVLVDEYRTSEEARQLYLSEHRTGWRRFVPLGLQTPAEPYDDYVAVILGKRYLETMNFR